MTIFGFLIVFKGKVVFEERLSGDKADQHSIELLVGIIKTLKSLGQTVGTSPARSFSSFTTSAFKIHSYQSPTGWEFVAITSPELPELQDKLRFFYASAFIPFVLHDPLRDPESCSVSAPFQTHVRSFLGGISATS